MKILLHLTLCKKHITLPGNTTAEVGHIIHIRRQKVYHPERFCDCRGLRKAFSGNFVKREAQIKKVLIRFAVGFAQWCYFSISQENTRICKCSHSNLYPPYVCDKFQLHMFRFSMYFHVRLKVILIIANR